MAEQEPTKLNPACKIKGTSKRQVIDITGQRFGRLVVLSFVGVSKYRNSRWLCLCDCGVTHITNGPALRSGESRSCGCYHRDRNKEKRLTLEQRFWLKVDKAPGHGPQGECWLWTGATSHGYGVIGTEGNRIDRTHKVSYRLAFGEIPTDQYVLHRCDVRNCVRPDHLFLGTNDDNMADMKAKGRAAAGQRHGMHTHPEMRPRGERQGSSRLTAEIVRLIRNEYVPNSQGPSSARSLAERFGVALPTVYDILSRKTWAHISTSEDSQIQWERSYGKGSESPRKG